MFLTKPIYDVARDEEVFVDSVVGIVPGCPSLNNLKYTRLGQSLICVSQNYKPQSINCIPIVYVINRTTTLQLTALGILPLCCHL